MLLVLFFSISFIIEKMLQYIQLFSIQKTNSYTLTDTKRKSLQIIMVEELFSYMLYSIVIIGMLFWWLWKMDSYLSFYKISEYIASFVFFSILLIGYACYKLPLFITSVIFYKKNLLYGLKYSLIFYLTFILLIGCFILIWEILQNPLFFSIFLFLLFIALFLAIQWYYMYIFPRFYKKHCKKSPSLAKQMQTYLKNNIKPIQSIYIIEKQSIANVFIIGIWKNTSIFLNKKLFESMKEEEIIAIILHEIGHIVYKHPQKMFFWFIVHIACTILFFSIGFSSPFFQYSLWFQTWTFHGGMITGILLMYPIHKFCTYFTNSLSWKYEFQADAFSYKTGEKDALIHALQKFHDTRYYNIAPAFLTFYSSHPPIALRIAKLLQT